MSKQPVVGIVGTRQAVRQQAKELEAGVVRSVNDKSGTVYLSASDVNAVPAPPRGGLRAILGDQAWVNFPLRAASWDDLVWSPELQRFVAIGYLGTEPHIAFSDDDGETWVSSSPPISIGAGLQLYDIIWVVERGWFVAVGHGGSVAWSVDGIAWNWINIGLTDISAVTYSPELDLFVFVTDGPVTRRTTRILTSRNLEHFEPIDVEFDSVVFSDVQWVPDLALFVATTSSFGHPTIFISHDGTNWSNPVPAGYAEGFGQVAWSPRLGRLCAVGYRSVSPGGAQCAISEDGENWTLRDMGFEVGFRDLVWCNGPDSFVALVAPGESVGTSPNAGKIVISNDGGETWGVVAAAAGGTPIHDYHGLTWAYDLGRVVSVGASGPEAERVLASRSVFHT